MGGGSGWQVPTADPAGVPTLIPEAPPSGATAPTGEPQTYNWLQGFAASAIAGFPELIGISPGRVGMDQDAIEAWRATHPIAGTISELAPGLIGMGGGAALGGRLIGRMVLGAAERAGLGATAQVTRAIAVQAPRIAAQPFAAGAVAGALELVPFEAARLGAAAAFGDEGSVARITGSALMDLAIGGAASGGLHWYRNAGSRDQDSLMRAIVNNYDGRASAQERLTAIFEARTAGSIGADALPMVEANAARLDREIRTAEVPRTDRYVDTLVGGRDGAQLNRYFNMRAVAGSGPQASTGILRRQFVVGEKGFQDGAEWQAIAQQAGMPEGWQASAQYPRVIDTRTPGTLEKMQRNLRNNMPTEVDGWRIVREANTGLSIMAKELSNGRFVMFKTATPSKFIQPSAFDILENRSMAYMRRVERPLDRAKTEELNATVGPDSVLNRTSGLQRDVTHEALDAVRRGKTAEDYYNMLPAGMRQLGKDAAELQSSAWQWVKSQVAPADALFRNAPGAALMRILANGVYDIAKGKAGLWTTGRAVVEEGKNLLTRSLRPKGGIQPIMQSMTESDFTHAINAMSNGGTLDSARTFLRSAVDNPEIEDEDNELPGVYL